MRAVAALSVFVSASAATAAADDFGQWEKLQTTFPSTGGNGIVIGEYRPVIVGEHCRTDFTATEPNGTVHRNTVEFDAVAAQGGMLCTNGRWRSADGKVSGTTPFRVFFRDGVARRSP